MKKIVLALIAIVLAVGLFRSFTSNAASSPQHAKITAVQSADQGAEQAAAAPQENAPAQPAMHSCGGSCNPASCGCSPSQCTHSCGGSCGQGAQSALR